jgi:hypothetical protein
MDQTSDQSSAPADDDQPTAPAPASSGARMDPPYLLQRSGDPVYDAADMARMVGVTPEALTEWEARYGVPRPRHLMDETGVMRPRYSERDLLATLWLTEQMRAGQTAEEAAKRLIAAQQSPPGATYGPPPSAPAPSVAPTTRGGLTGPVTFTPSTPSLRRSSGPLVEVAPRTGGLPYPTMDPAPRTGTPSRPLTGPMPHQAPTSGPLPGQRANLSLPLSGSAPSWPAAAAPTGRLRGDGSMSGTYGAYGAHTTGGLRMLAGALLQALVDLDPNEARRALDEALNQFALESVLLRLIQPVAARLGDLLQAGHISPATERFGYMTLRNRLAALVDALVAPLGAPLTLVACAPGEHGELEPLIHTILWRRANLRAICLGAGLQEEALVAAVRERRPIVLYLLAATEPGARAIAQVGDNLVRLDPPRPLFGFGGAAYVRMPQLQTRVRDGYFLGADATVATRHLLQMLHDGPLSPR